MARQQGSGGRVITGTTGKTADQLITFRFRIEGAEKGSDAFKAIKRDINKRMRDTMVRVGERDLLPAIRRRIEYPWMAQALKIHRERSGVFVGTTLPKVGTKKQSGRRTDRALGYLDFGGRWHSQPGAKVYEGRRAITSTVNERRRLIDDRVLAGVLAEFREKGFDVGKGIG